MIYEILLFVLLIVAGTAAYLFYINRFRKNQYDAIKLVDNSNSKDTGKHPPTTFVEGCPIFVSLPSLASIGNSVHVVSPTLAKQVLVDYNDALVRWVPFIPKTSLFALNGEDHQRHYKVVSKALRKEFVADLKNVMGESCTSLTEKLKTNPVVEDLYAFSTTEVSNAITMLTWGTSSDSIELGRLHSTLFKRDFTTLLFLIFERVLPLVSKVSSL